MSTAYVRRVLLVREGGRWLLLCFLLLSLCASGPARGQPVHGIYAEIFGKGGLWGLGYDYRLHQRFTVGAVASAYSLDGQRVISFSPYVGAYLARSGPHAWFADLGSQIVHTWAPSPIPEWRGHSASGIGALIATGYEYRARILVRVFAEGVAGKGGAFPWLGAGIGCAF